jgi:hypothetical protein
MSIYRPSKPDISPDPIERWRIPMKNLILAAFAALSLSAAVAPMAYAYTGGSVHNAYHSGPFDNTGNGPGETGQEGGGG